MKYGLFDRETRLWLGDMSGPKLFEEHDKLFADVAAQIADKQAGQKPGRTRAMPYPENQTPRHRDSVDTVMTPLEALIELEEGK